MTREEAIEIIKCGDISNRWGDMGKEAEQMAIKALEQDPCDKYIKEIDHLRKYIYKLETQIVEQDPCDDAISRHAAIKAMCDASIPIIHEGKPSFVVDYVGVIETVPPVTPQPKMGHCKDCKWWKDSDGVYRRGVGSESQCPINRREVLEGNGYCYMFESKMQEVEEKN